jgi:dolichol-phosphate mannosyltransferase
MARTLVTVCCYNTRDATRRFLDRFPEERDYDVLLINDGSTDGTRDILSKEGFKVIEHEQNRGLGAAIKTGIGYALENKYDIIVIMAGNDKDDPNEIPKLTKAIFEDGYDYVQGSRFFKGGRWDNLPLSRYVMIRLYSILLSVIFRTKITDPANGFRAYRASIFDDERIDIWQDWLNHYEFETYLTIYVLKIGYKYGEVPVSKIYPKRKRKVKYSHIRPFVDWWSILRPLLLVGFRIKK